MSPNRPSFRWSFRVARVAGVDIRLHATMVILLTWVVVEHLRLGEVAALLEGLALGACTFASITLHELGHVLVARRYGIVTRDITLLPIGGVATMERMPERPKEEIVVALAGPLVNLAIAGALFVALALAQLAIDVRVLHLVGGPLLGKLMVINLSIAVFNLVPAFPMDGGRVLRALLARGAGRVRATQVAARVGQVVAIAFAGAGLLLTPVLVIVAIFVWMGAEAELAAVQLQAKLAGLKAADAMVATFQSLESDTPISEAMELSARGFQRDFPVRSGGQVVGVLSRESLLSAAKRDGDHAPVSHAIEGRLTSVEAATPLAAVLELMRANHVSAAVVVDHGELAGLLTADSVFERLARVR